MPQPSPAPKPEQPPVRYEVRIAGGGAHVCGPYDQRADANREMARLNREAASGQTAHEQPGMNDGRLNRDSRPIMHQGQPVRYEVVTVGGIALGEGA